MYKNLQKCSFSARQLFKTVQGDEDQGPAELVSTNSEGASLPSYQVSTNHPPWSQVRQHLHHRPHWIREDWRSWPRYPQEGIFCQECYRYVTTNSVCRFCWQEEESLSSSEVSFPLFCFFRKCDLTLWCEGRPQCFCEPPNHSKPGLLSTHDSSSLF